MEFKFTCGIYFFTQANIKNVIYDYEFWKKAVIIDTKLALLCVREKTGQPVAFLQI